MQRDLEQLQGRWQIIALEVDGRTISKDSFDGAKIIIDGDNFATMGMACDGGICCCLQNVCRQGTYKTLPSGVVIRFIRASASHRAR
jgi:hypothetical protein